LQIGRRCTLYLDEVQGRTHIYYSNNFSLSRKNGTLFGSYRIYCPVDHWKGAVKMRENGDPNADLDDLIFDEDAGGPSER
jgi:hypothetical protein